MTPLILTAAQQDEAALLYVHHDWPMSEIAEQFAVSENAVKNALRHRGIDASCRIPPPPLRMKQCTRCLHFLPVALFAGRGDMPGKLASWCSPCTNHPAEPQWHLNPAPLSQAVNHWRT